jgi:hypothetical protein
MMELIDEFMVMTIGACVILAEEFDRMLQQSSFPTSSAIVGLEGRCVLLALTDHRYLQLANSKV